MIPRERGTGAFCKGFKWMFSVGVRVLFRWLLQSFTRGWSRTLALT